MNEYDANLWSLETVLWFWGALSVIIMALGALITRSHTKFLERILDDLPVREDHHDH